MKLRFIFLLAIVFFAGNLPKTSAQVDSFIGQISDSVTETFVTGISGDGRFVVMESTGNIATVNPRNEDGNREIFLFDYAQRRIFQITDTKSLLKDATKSPTFDNIKVQIVNQRPVISHDGRYIAFSSNATCNYPGNPTADPPIDPIVSNTNPGNFDPNTTDLNFPCNSEGTTEEEPVISNLVNDGNTEIWIYEIPAYAPVSDLSLGDEAPFTDLSAGTFIQATNTLPFRLPSPGTTTATPIISDDNRDVSINANGNVLAFVSNRDLVPCENPTAECGNKFPEFDNAEIFTYVRSLNKLGQVTATPRGTVLAPIYNLNPNISGDGLKVSFVSNAHNPIKGMTSGDNSDRSDEIFYAVLDANGDPTAPADQRQVTKTSTTTSGTTLNIFSYGNRMSRDGRYIVFESLADLTEENNNNNYTTRATFIWDATVNAPQNPFRRITPRADADSGVVGGDSLRFPTFTDYDANGTPASVVLTTRLNITSAGTIPSNADDGLNPNSARPPQIYTFALDPANTTPFTRLTKFPSFGVVANTQAYASDSAKRMSFSIAQVELGTGNFDYLTEAYYLLTPQVTSNRITRVRYATGASAIPVSDSPVPTPSPTATPSPSPSVTPTPETPPAVHGVAPGMLAILNFDTGFVQTIPARTAVGGLDRRFQLPIELSGVSMSINGAAAELKSVNNRQIVFIVPRGLSPGNDDAATYPVVINNNGIISRAEITIVPARPDIFTDLPTPGPGGRAFVQNVTNRVPTTEPFTVTTIKIKGGTRVPTVLRVYATGIFHPALTSGAFSIRIGSRTIPATTLPVQRGPGIYSLDFTLPPELNEAGDQPIIFQVVTSTQTYRSRLDDTAPRLFIL